jgi:Cytidylyltransferase-like
MGADNLAGFHRWQRWREILTMVPVVVVDRPGWRLKALASKAARAFATSRVPEARAQGLVGMPPPAWTFLTGPLSCVSSTELRKQRGQSVARKAQKRNHTVATAGEWGAASCSGCLSKPGSSVSEPLQVGGRQRARARPGKSPARAPARSKAQGS